MTLEEKVGQLMQYAGAFYSEEANDTPITGPAELPIGQNEVKKSGSVLGVAGAKKTLGIQKEHLKTNRLGIPLLFMADVINGYRTIFPIPLALGSTWEPELVKEAQTIAAKEAASAGVHVCFAPMVDLVRDPRWGRVMESTGEDPYLNSRFAEATIKGFQGDDLQKDVDRVAACVKHFAAYGAAEAGRDYNTVDMSERELREQYLPAYKAALDAGSELVMTAFNTVDSIPATGNKKLMRGILREEFGFGGVLISDYGAVGELIPHGVAADEKEAAQKAIVAGVDIEMMSLSFENELMTLVEAGTVPLELVDEAVLRILTLKDKLGLFDDPYRKVSEAREQEVLFAAEHRELAQKTAEKSTVLLKNNGLLPLKESKLALVGPYADNRDLLGEWSIFGRQEEAVTLKEGMQRHNVQFEYAEGSHMYERDEVLLQEAIELAQSVDTVVLALGEGRDRSGEGRSRANITLEECQLELIRELKALGKKVVVVLFNARPLDLTEVDQLADAVLEAWHPGSEGGTAVANLLFGTVVPSGKLSMSFPRTVGQIPLYYNSYSTGRPLPEKSDERFFSRYIDVENTPLYPFGHGLSYADFQYENLSLSDTELSAESTIVAKVDITNTSEYAGEETVQLYIQDVVGEVVRPVKELKGFEKVFIEANNTLTVSFTITEEMLRYHHADLSYCSDPGAFRLFIGTSSSKTIQAEFNLKK